MDLEIQKNASSGLLLYTTNCVREYDGINCFSSLKNVAAFNLLPVRAEGNTHLRLLLPIVATTRKMESNRDPFFSIVSLCGPQTASHRLSFLMYYIWGTLHLSFSLLFVALQRGIFPSFYFTHSYSMFELCFIHSFKVYYL